MKTRVFLGRANARHMKDFCDFVVLILSGASVVVCGASAKKAGLSNHYAPGLAEGPVLEPPQRGGYFRAIPGSWGL